MSEIIKENLDSRSLSLFNKNFEGLRNLKFDVQE